ncbi:MAG: ABC transporter permease [Bacteroidota bacterium]
MLKGYLKIALRKNKKKGIYVLMNMFGLVVGLTCIMVVGIYARYELGYDKSLDKSESIYRLVKDYRSNLYSTVAFSNYFRATREEQLELPVALRELPGVEEVAQFHIVQTPTYIDVGSTRYVEERVLITNTGPQFFDLYRYSFIEGSSEEALRAPRRVVLTESVARKYFGGQNALGQSMSLNGADLEVGGVIEDPEPNSHFSFGLAISSDRVPHWGAYVYLRLQDGVSLGQVTALVSSTMDSIDPDRIDNPLVNGEILQPIHSIHFGEATLYDPSAPGDPRYMYGLIAFALIILVVTCINYVNMSVAMMSDRYEEAGLRKFYGSGRLGIVGQHLLEYVLFSIVCVPISVILVSILLVPFNAVMDLQLENIFLRSPLWMVVALAAGLTVGLVAGLYPVSKLASRPALGLLKPPSVASGGRLGLRGGLILVQFSLLIGAGALAVLINQQMHFIETIDLGYDRENVVSLRGIGGIEAYEEFRQRVALEPSVIAVGTGAGPGEGGNSTTYVGENSPEVLNDGDFLYLDLGWFEAMRVGDDVLERVRSSGEDRPYLFFVNEAAAQVLGYDSPVGRTVVIGPEDGGGETYEISGVLDNLFLRPLRQQVRPMFIRVYREPEVAFDALVRLDETRVPEGMGVLESAWQAVNPAIPFQPTFIDDDLRLMYLEEERAAYLSIALAIVALIIGVLGVLGLSSFMASQRKKEIAVRRVLGASVLNIIYMLNKEFVALIGISFIVAAIPAYLLGSRWLSNFAYHVDISIVVISLCGFMALALAVIAVTLQGLRTVQADPVSSLREV